MVSTLAFNWTDPWVESFWLLFFVIKFNEFIDNLLWKNSTGYCFWKKYFDLGELLCIIYVQIECQLLMDVRQTYVTRATIAKRTFDVLTYLIVRVVSHSGSYGEWGFDQPNNYDGHQWCGALDRFKATKLADESCDESKVYICKLGECCALKVKVWSRSSTNHPERQ